MLQHALVWQWKNVILFLIFIFLTERDI